MHNSNSTINNNHGRSNETCGPLKHLSGGPSLHHVPTEIMYLLCTRRHISYCVPACSYSLQCTKIRNWPTVDAAIVATYTIDGSATVDSLVCQSV